MMYITRRERFSAAHKQWNPDLSESENKKLFGQCSNFNFHGHNYELFVTIKGEIDPKSSYVMDIKLLSKIIKEEILDFVDHKNLNIDVDFLKGINPTSENLVLHFWMRLNPIIKNYDCQLHCIKLVETENNFIEYYG